MSSFEFITVLLSIVVGLALTRLLGGLGRALELRRRLSFYWVQGIWVLNIALALVTFWWATLFSHSEAEIWRFSNFALLLLYSVFLFLQAVLIIPSSLEKTPDLEEHFYSVRPWFFPIGALVSAAELGDTYLHGGMERILGFGLYYFFMMTSGIVLNLVAAKTTQRWFHGAFCIAYLAILLSWIFMRFGTIGS